jgi:thioesterase domain-containing protein
MSVSQDKRFRDEWESAVAEAYADELALAEITPRTRFTGDAAAADRVAARVSKVTKTRLSGDVVLDRDYVEAVAAHLRAQAPKDRCVQLPAGFDPQSPALFYFHSASGNALAIRTLRNVLPAQPISVRGAGLEGEREIPRTIAEFADVYLEELRQLPECEPYLLCGFSTGGTIAFELACRLVAEGRKVGLLALFDSQPPNTVPLENIASEQVEIAGRLRELLRRIGVDVPDTITVNDDGVVSSLREARVLAETLGAETLQRQLVMFARSVRADRFYRPGYYDGELHYFNAYVDGDLISAWNPHARRVHRHGIDADHQEYSIFGNADFRTIFTDVVREAIEGRP